MKYILLLFILLTSCNKEEGINEIPFNQTNNLPIVTLTVNEEHCKFLVDTGSTLTVIDKSKQSKYKFYTTDSNRNVEGIGGNVYLEEVHGVKLKYKDSTVVATFVSFDMSNVGEKIGISGILGSDFLELNGYSVDFKKNKLRR